MLTRYCFDREGVVIPAMVDALDRWPMDQFEQIMGIGAERSDLAYAWQEFRHRRMQHDAQQQAAADAMRPTR